MNWHVVVNPTDHYGEIQVPAAALDAAPPELAEGGRGLLPRGPMEGRCLLCGQEGPLTREHIPPRAAGNRGVVTGYGYDEWIESDGDLAALSGETQQGGIFGYTLCADCNSKTGSWYGPEYLGWAQRGASCLRQLMPLRDRDNREEFTETKVLFENVSPGSFARQVLTIMCSLSGPWDIAGRHPEIQDIVLHKAQAPLPAGLAMGIGLYGTPQARLAGPTLHIDRSSQRWQWLIEIAFPPFVLAATLAGDQTLISLFDLGQFTLGDPSEKGDLEMDLPLCWAHTPYPGDYRSRGQLAQSLRDTPPDADEERPAS